MYDNTDSAMLHGGGLGSVIGELQRRHYGSRIQRLEVGRYPFPPVTDGRLELTATQFAMILDGLDPATARPRSRR